MMVGETYGRRYTVMTRVGVHRHIHAAIFDVEEVARLAIDDVIERGGSEAAEAALD